MNNHPNGPHLLLPGCDSLGNAELPPPPAHLDYLPELADRHKARELWIAAWRLLEVCDCWLDWWIEFREKGDADPVLAFRYRDAAVSSIRTLASYEVDLPIFRLMSDVELIDRLPPCPDGSLERPRYEFDESQEEVVVVGRSPSWQKNPQFLCAGFAGDGRGTSLLDELVGYMRGLIKELTHAPLAAIQPRRCRIVDETTLETWRERLRIDLVTGTARLDGVPFKKVDRKVLLILVALLQAGGEIVKQKELQQLPGLRNARIDRVLEKAPLELARIVKSQRGTGFWLELGEVVQKNP